VSPPLVVVVVVVIVVVVVVVGISGVMTRHRNHSSLIVLSMELNGLLAVNHPVSLLTWMP